MKVPVELKIKLNETFDDYKKRIVLSKEKLNLTWSDVADIIELECGVHKDESTYRKYHKTLTNDFDKPVKQEIDQESIELLTRIKMEKTKLSDERTQNNAILRRLSREETIKEIAHDVATQMNSKKILDNHPLPIDCIINDNTSAILTLSDWHYGIVCDNYWNKYDPEIAKKRISKLKQSVIEKCKSQNCKEIYVVNLSDLISGRIHLTIRLQNRIDVITQIIQVSEIMAEFLTDLSENMIVHYYDCLDNHSRIEPNKKESLDLESLVRIIPWYLRTRLKSDHIFIHNNEFGDDIISFECRGYQIIGVHGDNDKPMKVVDNLTLLTHKHYDLVLTAHLHHFSGDEKNQTLVVSNGSLMGTDSYAEKLRLSSKPSQNLIIVTDKSVADSIHRIVLD